MTAAELTPQALEDLQNELPDWWAKEQPASEVYKLLTTLAEGVAYTEDAFERLRLNVTILTADREGLLDLAWVYGIAAEEAPLGLEPLRAYLISRLAEDGTLLALETTLLTMLLTPVNLEGIELMFPGDGSGFTFPGDGSGIRPLFQAANYVRPWLVFPTDGSGFVFPRYSLTFPDDGSGLQFDVTFADEPPLTFPSLGLLSILEYPSFYVFLVIVKSFLAFDRAAFDRAVERVRGAHLAWVRVETNY